MSYEKCGGSPPAPRRGEVIVDSITYSGEVLGRVPSLRSGRSLTGFADRSALRALPPLQAPHAGSPPAPRRGEIVSDAIKIQESPIKSQESIPPGAPASRAIPYFVFSNPYSVIPNSPPAPRRGEIVSDAIKIQESPIKSQESIPPGAPASRAILHSVFSNPYAVIPNYPPAPRRGEVVSDAIKIQESPIKNQKSIPPGAPASRAILHSVFSNPYSVIPNSPPAPRRGQIVSDAIKNQESPIKIQKSIPPGAPASRAIPYSVFSNPYAVIPNYPPAPRRGEVVSDAIKIQESPIIKNSEELATISAANQKSPIKIQESIPPGAPASRAIPYSVFSNPYAVIPNSPPAPRRGEIMSDAIKIQQSANQEYQKNPSNRAHPPAAPFPVPCSLFRVL